ncbi:glucans biosynthesis glucosyltransferase MdoH [Roseomonas elaeocarpi]|uniref:Glucans biosynthesis glucosyltransferase H n=1 Tax=Roseomonas elaeocarpi TaxID=907779 RepID=A0ABV6JW09_9PROT
MPDDPPPPPDGVLPPPSPFPPDPVARRRVVFVLLCALTALALLWLLWRALSPGGWTVWEVVVLLCFAGTVPWSAIGLANAAIGLAILLRHGAAVDAARAVMPQLGAPPAPGQPPLRTALLCCLRREPMAAVLPPLERLLDGLEAAGAGGRFALWFLSDTPAAEAAIEEAAVARFQAGRGTGGEGRVAVHYRRRTDNAGFKAGNVMEFLDRRAGGWDLFLLLDADSEMTAPAVLRLVRCMEADPALAVVQPLIVGRPADTAFTRLFQFGMRAGMRAWATGQAWWQGDDGPYWGHNAVLRIAPFRAHARLAPLPDGRAILSHDQVEAVQLQAAGWKLRCLPLEDGSLEGNPPAMPEFLARDQRWGEGNMQYLSLLGRPGLRGMGRWQLCQAILLFLGAPLWLLLAGAAVMNAATGGGAATPDGALAAAIAATWVCAYSSKLAAYAELMLRPRRAAPYGGRLAVLRGAVAELVFTALFDPVSLFNKGFFLLALPLRRWRGKGGNWAAQRRESGGVGWGAALRLLWPHTLLGWCALLALATVSPAALFWGGCFLLGPALSVPLCVATASPRLGAAMRRWGLAATPEEVAAGAAHPVPRGFVAGGVAAS